MAVDASLKARFEEFSKEKKERILKALHSNLRPKNEEDYKEATRAMSDEELEWMTDYFKGHISGGK